MMSKGTPLKNGAVPPMPASNVGTSSDTHSIPSLDGNLQPYEWNRQLQQLMRYNPAALHQAFMMSLQQRHFPVPSNSLNYF